MPFKSLTTNQTSLEYVLNEHDKAGWEVFYMEGKPLRGQWGEPVGTNFFCVFKKPFQLKKKWWQFWK